MKIFVSSVISGFEAVRIAVRRAIETVDDEPIMCEEFGARPYSPERACLTEVEACDAYVLILGERYGYEQADGVSVTQQEFRRAVELDKPVLIFIQDAVMEEKQAIFRDEVANYHSGFCREIFGAPEELKDKVIQNLLRLQRKQTACTQHEFAARIERTRPNGWSSHQMQYDATFTFAFLPQPTRDVRIEQLELQRNETFATLCRLGLTEMRRGFMPIDEPDHTGLEAGKTSLRQYDDGLVIFETPATVEAAGISFSQWYVPPSHLTKLALTCSHLLNANGGWFRLGLAGMEQAVMHELPAHPSNSFSMSHRGDAHAAQDKLLIPSTEAAYRAWVEIAIERLKRQFGSQ